MLGQRNQKEARKVTEEMENESIGKKKEGKLQIMDWLLVAHLRAMSSGG